MDRMIFIAMTGAKHLLDRQATIAENLANVASDGYRAQTHALRAVYVQSRTLPTRSFVVEQTTGADFTQGPLRQTGRELDVAVQGMGWITVGLPDGSEAYTRTGNLRLNETGLLQTATGLNVLGETGPITVPPDTQIAIAPDGTVSTVPTTNLLAQVSIVGRMRLVNPDEAQLERGADGLFRLRSRAAAPLDESVRIASGFLESSNVNAAGALVDMISVARQYETQMKLLQNADANARQAAQLFSVTR